MNGRTRQDKNTDTHMWMVMEHGVISVWSDFNMELTPNTSNQCDFCD